jgi:hypothetical protein
MPNVTLSFDLLSNLLGSSTSNVHVENMLFVNDNVVLNGDNITFRNCRFISNQSYTLYWNIAFYGNYLTVENCEFFGIDSNVSNVQFPIKAPSGRFVAVLNSKFIQVSGSVWTEGLCTSF